MRLLLKNAREARQMKIIDISKSLHIDAALVSKFESGQRMPTQEQIVLLANLLNIDLKELQTAWLKEKILLLVHGNDVAVAALNLALSTLQPNHPVEEIATPSIEKLMAEMENLKSILSSAKK